MLWPKDQAQSSRILNILDLRVRAKGADHRARACFWGIIVLTA